MHGVIYQQQINAVPLQLHELNCVLDCQAVCALHNHTSLLILENVTVKSAQTSVLFVFQNTYRMKAVFKCNCTMKVVLIMKNSFCLDENTSNL